MWHPCPTVLPQIQCSKGVITDSPRMLSLRVQAYRLPEYFSDDWLNEYYDSRTESTAVPGSTSNGSPADDAAAGQPSGAAAVTSDYR
jgi:hypothetical protein